MIRLYITFLSFLLVVALGNKMVVVTSKDFADSSSFGSYIYDVTEPLREILDQGTESLNNKSLENSGVHLSPYMFHREVYWHASQIPINIAKYYYPALFREIDYPEFDLIFKRNYTNMLPSFLSTSAVDHHPDAIILKMQDLSRYDCAYYCYLMSPFVFKINGSVAGSNEIKFGVAVNEKAMNCIIGCSYVVPNLDLIVFNVNIHPITTISSYGQFSKTMQTILAEKDSFVKDVTSNCEFFLRVSISEYRNELLEQANPYRATIAHFAETWLEREKAGNVIIDTFPISVQHVRLQDKLDNVSPFMFGGDISIESNCELNTLIGRIGHSFKNVFYGFRKYNQFVKILPNCTLSKNRNSSVAHNESNSFALNLILRDVYDIETAVSSIKEASATLNLNEVYFSFESYNQTDLEKLWNVTSPRNISLGCIENIHYHKDFGGFLEHGSRHLCDAFLNQSKIPLLIVQWNGEISAQRHDDYQLFFDASLEYRHNFTRDYPKGKLLLQLPVYDYVGATLGSQFRSNLYCSPHFKTVKEFYDAIATLATIYNFQLLSHPLLDSQVATGLWYNVITEDGLNKTIAGFPVVVRRNVPDTAEEDTEFPYNYPCIHRTAKVNSIISLETNIFSGIDLTLGLTKKSAVTKEEIQTLLLFAFGRFASVEIVRSDNQFLTIMTALTKELKDALRPREKEVEKLRLYLEFGDVITLETYMKVISEPDFAPTGLHLMGWEKHTSQVHAQINEVLQNFYKQSQNIDFGITVQNCTHEINVRLARIRSLSYFPFIKYVVCIVRPFDPTHFDKVIMQKYLDTHLYIKQYFQNFLQIETFFRLSLLPKQISEYNKGTTNYLKFVNDTNQYAEGYKIKYFMGDAFSNDDHDIWSWWRISRNGDLNDASVYRELESEYFNQPTEQKYKLPPTPFQYIPLVIGLAAVSLFLLGAVFCLGFYHRRMKQRFLTREEVNAFRHGEVVQRNEESIGPDHIQVNTIKTLGFDPKYEISKRHIELYDEIGRGNFGVVYTAMLKGRKEVAVKFPHEDCTKAAFKSMLAEVKTYCYIGNHHNVLAFIGAYTKEIDNGMIYIVTEYCNNGSLESYLRRNKMQRKLSDLESSANSAGYVSGSDIMMEPVINYVVINTICLESCEEEDELVDVGELQRFSYEIACGMEYISNKKVIHSDLASRNVLLTEAMTCKIGDFGLSRKLYDNKQYIKKGLEDMPWRWMAVESLRRMEFTSKSDVWSFGVTLWEIFSLGDIPYAGTEYHPEFCDKLEEGLRVPKPPHASEDLFNKISECWNTSPDQRPSFTELVKFLKEFQ